MARDEHYEKLVEHLADREWSDVQIINLGSKIVRSALLCSKDVLELFEYQQEVDEGIAAEKEADRVFIPGDGWGGGLGRRVIAESFFEDSSEAIEPGFIQQRFGEQQ